MSAFRRKLGVVGGIAVVTAALGVGVGIGWPYYRQYQKDVTRENAAAVVRNVVDKTLAGGHPSTRMAELEAFVTRDRLENMARAGGDWILGMQTTHGRNRGRFLYEFDPTQGHPPDTSFDSDNFLRQAGTNYSLLLLYEATGEEKYLKGAERGVDYLLTRLKDDERVPGQSYFEYERKVKLGGAALPMLSLIKLKTIRETERYDEILARVANFLIYMQQPDGEYRSYYKYNGLYEGHEKFEWDSNIYPGEAMLALTRFYALTGDPRWRNSVRNAREFFADRPQRHERAAFIPWTTTAMVEMAELTGEAAYRDFAFTMSDWIIDEVQNLEPELEIFGSFHVMPSVNTGTYLEGILDAYRLAVHEKDTARAERYRLSAMAGYKFLSTLQFDAETVQPYAQYEKYLLGGFFYSHSDRSVRIDNTQHAVSAIVKGMAYLFGNPPRLERLPAAP